MENKTDYAKLLNSVNSQFKKLSDLELNKHYKVKYYEAGIGKFGDQLIANIEDFKVSLPQRFNKLIPEIENINKNPPGFTYKGKIEKNKKQIHDIKFI